MLCSVISLPIKNGERAIFCPNQVTLILALALAKRDQGPIRTTIFFWPDRCDVSALENEGIACVRYSRTNCLRFLFTHRLRTAIEACVPHHRMGRFVNLFCQFCTSLSLIDDGLDTFRDVPRNVEPECFVPGTSFYTFDYRIGLGRWLERFRIEGVADMALLAAVSRSPTPLRGVRRLVIESPPLDRIADQLGLERSDTLLVTHSNVYKRVFNDSKIAQVAGSTVAIEKSLIGFTGEVIVGESMVAVFALLQERPRFRLYIYISGSQLVNLRPLVNLIRSRDFATLVAC